MNVIFCLFSRYLSILSDLCLMLTNYFSFLVFSVAEHSYLFTLFLLGRMEWKEGTDSRIHGWVVCLSTSAVCACMSERLFRLAVAVTQHSNTWKKSKLGMLVASLSQHNYSNNKHAGIDMRVVVAVCKFVK